jgi:hypothetical protein
LALRAGDLLEDRFFFGSSSVVARLALVDMFTKKCVDAARLSQVLRESQ